MLKKAKNREAAWDMGEKFEGQVSGFIQWKGTDVCMDIHCKCGHHSHIDADFAYNIECPKCHTVYATGCHVELIELEERPENCIVMDQTFDINIELDQIFNDKEGK